LPSAPAIGICAAVELVSWGVWSEVEAALVPRTYATAVQRAGGVALVLPPDGSAPGHPRAWLDRIDALLLAGGSDIDPATYGAEADAHTGHTWPDRDSFEVALATGALERGMPVLGICRGMQLLNVALGGTLAQHLPDELGSDRHLHTPGAFADHSVRLESGSLAARAIGAGTTQVKSHHHQGVDRLGEGLVATGWSVEDEVIEAVEMPGDRFCMGVLWHPEEDGESLVIRALVEAAGEMAAL
jgi:putative glutamine amidotransferase